MKEPLVKGGQGRPDILEEDVSVSPMWLVVIVCGFVMAAFAIMIYG